MVDLKFHNDKYLISSDKKIVKVWEPNADDLTGSDLSYSGADADVAARRPGGSNLTSIQPIADINDVAIYQAPTAVPLQCLLPLQ